MMLPITRAAAPLAVLLALAATVLTGCADDGSDSPDDESTASASSESTEAGGPESSVTDEMTDDPTDAPAPSGEACDLITPEEAEEIMDAGPLEAPLSSPPAVECQYVPVAGGATLDLYKGDAATALVKSQRETDPDFSTEPVDGVGEEAEVVNFAGCGGIRFRTADDEWWYLYNLCDIDDWDQRQLALIDLAKKIVERYGA